MVAVFGATFLRYDMRLAPVNVRGVVLVALVAGLTQVVVGYAFGLYRRGFRYGSFDEMRRLAPAMGVTALVAFIVVALDGGSLVPRQRSGAGALPRTRHRLGVTVPAATA